jgi:WD40 repeat protein
VLFLPRGKPPELADLKNDAPPASLSQIGDSSNLLAVCGTNILCHWNGTNRVAVLELRGLTLTPMGAVPVDSGLRPNGVDYNADRQTLAWNEATNSASVFVAKLPAPRSRIELKSDVPGLAFLRWSQDGNHLYGTPKNATCLRVWNVETRQIVVSLNEPMHSNPMFAAGGRVLVVPIGTRLNHEIAFYDLAQPGNAGRRFPGKYFAPGLAVSPDGRLVACPNEAGVVRFFDAFKSDLIESIHGHLNGVHGVAFSPDGERLISTSGVREAVKLWDVSTRQELLTLTGIGGALYGATWSGDGDIILVGAPWQAWRAPSWEEIAAAEAKDNAENKQQ